MNNTPPAAYARIDLNRSLPNEPHENLPNGALIVIDPDASANRENSGTLPVSLTAPMASAR